MTHRDKKLLPPEGVVPSIKNEPDVTWKTIKPPDDVLPMLRLVNASAYWQSKEHTWAIRMEREGRFVRQAFIIEPTYEDWVSTVQMLVKLLDEDLKK